MKLSVYLAGAIEGAINGGQGWRDEITPLLEQLGFTVYNPLKDTANLFVEVAELKQQNKMEEVASLKWIRDRDLVLVDQSDVIICYLDMDEKPVGTFEEIFRANEDKKPVLLWIKQPLNSLSSWILWTFPIDRIFSSRDDLLKSLKSGGN